MDDEREGVVTDDSITEGRRLELAATAGEWVLAWQYRDCGRCRTEGVVREQDDGAWVDLTGDDIRLIVHLRNHAPAWWDEIERLRDEVAAWNGRMDERRHEIEFRDDGWTIAHPLHERIEGTLFDCRRQWFDTDPGVRGRFYLNDDGSIGAPLAATTPTEGDNDG